MEEVRTVGEEVEEEGRWERKGKEPEAQLRDMVVQ